MKVAITGASGFIGNQLLTRLALAQVECVSLSRKSKPKEVENALLGADAVVHLAGESVAGARWTEETKKNILDSRVLGTRALIEAISKLPEQQRLKTLICASAIGFYGDRGDEELTEDSGKGNGFLADVVNEWEAEARTAEKLGIRVVCIRIGVVLGVGGGALQKMQAVVLGSGEQWMSWVHIDDVTRFIQFCVENQSCQGVYNLSAPEPVRNSEFTRQFAKATGVGITMKVPEVVLKTAMGEMACIVLDSCRVIPERTISSGFKFIFIELKNALTDVYPHPLESRFSSAQFVPFPIEKVFTYFSLPKNLEELTPPWLNFNIVACSTDEIKQGTLIDYKLKVHGVPMKWRTLIEKWEPGKMFVDTQLKGPYKKWHHTHRFETVPGGTLLLDEVVYQVPGGLFGGMVGGSFIRKDIETIFSYRKKKIAELFPQ